MVSPFSPLVWDKRQNPPAGKPNFFTHKRIKILDIAITHMCNYVTFFIVFLIRFIVVFSDSSSMSILGDSGSFGPIRGSLLL